MIFRDILILPKKAREVKKEIFMANHFVYQGGVGEIEEKKSRFIATVQPVHTEEEALKFLAEQKKKYWDARHNCHAFIIGKNQELQRCSDDGEPAGTAGRPMLEVLLHEDLHDVAVVVTRYFGGTLLGTGGLVRAYQKAVQEGLAASVIGEKNTGRTFAIKTDYSDYGKLEFLFREQGYELISSEFTDAVELKIVVPMDEVENMKNLITDATGGRAQIQLSDPMDYAWVDGGILFY